MRASIQALPSVRRGSVPLPRSGASSRCRAGESAKAAGTRSEVSEGSVATPGRSLHVWGTGSLRQEDRLSGLHRLHALRGRLTLARCERVETPPRLGDPGLLAGLLLDGPVEKRHAVGVIPHLADREHTEVVSFVSRTANARLLALTSPVGDLLAAVASCERILSSGLHGLVFADAFGIPNRWFTASGALTGGRHKFDDYYSAFDLHQDPVRLPGLNLEAAFDGYARPRIETIKRELLESFPFR